MSENNQDTTSDTDSLDYLSVRVSKVLEQDAQRRRWITRTFMLLALIPVIAAGLMFVLGRSEVEQTQRLVQDQTRNLEAQVTQKITASVASELEGAREVNVLLPELKEAVRVTPLVQEQQRSLSEYRTRVDSALQRQDELARSVQQASRELIKIPEKLVGLESRLQDVSRRSDQAETQAAVALREVNNTAMVLERRLVNTEGKIAQVEHLDQSINSVRREMQNTRKDMKRQMQKQFAALSEPLSDVRRIGKIEKQVKSMSGLTGSLKLLEAKIAKLPTRPVITNTPAVDKSSLSKQFAGIKKRLSALERSRKATGNASLERAVKSLHKRIGEINRSIAGIDKRLKKLEPAQFKIIKPHVIIPR